MDFKEVEQAIQRGKLVEARRLLKAFTKLETFPVDQLLTYFRYVRRVGDFYQGARILEKFDNTFPELENEKAYFLGELGAFRQAVLLLQKNRLPMLTLDQKIEKQMHLGHFQSLQHDYAKAIDAYDTMASLAGDERPMQNRIGRLNEIGHRIYAKDQLKEQIERLDHLRRTSLTEFPLLEQGAFYFLTLAYMGLNDFKKARVELEKAFRLGTKHRLRESLLLTLTHFELHMDKISKSSLSRMKKDVLQQNHIVYFDQFNKILGKMYLQRNEKAKAEKHFLKVLYGDRSSYHSAEVRSLYDSENQLQQRGWLWKGDQVEALTKHQLIYNKIEKSRPPLFERKKARLSLQDVPSSLRLLTEKLSQNFEFPIRDAELWQLLEKEDYLFSYSIDQLKATLARWRKSDLSNYAEISYSDHRLCLRRKEDSVFYRVLIES